MLFQIFNKLLKLKNILQFFNYQLSLNKDNIILSIVYFIKMNKIKA